MRSSAIMDRLAALLERSAPFDRLREEDRRRLLVEVLIEQGRTSHEHVYLVESGFVRLVDTVTGMLVAEYGEGGAFGSHGHLRPYPTRPGRPTPRYAY